MYIYIYIHIYMHNCNCEHQVLKACEVGTTFRELGLFHRVTKQKQHPFGERFPIWRPGQYFDRARELSNI